MSNTLFKVPVVWSAMGYVTVNADNEEVAMKYAKEHLDEFSLPIDSEYLDDSFEVDEEGMGVTRMTLKDIIDSRGGRFDRDIQERVPMAEFWQGYQHGWKMAYQDLREILDHYGFDKNIVVIREDK